MPKFFCDYCDVYLTHDSMSVRKAHNSGRNHLRNVIDYYQQIGHEKAQSVIDSITNSYAAEGQAANNPMLNHGAPGFGPPGMPGGIGGGMIPPAGLPPGFPPPQGMPPGFPPPPAGMPPGFPPMPGRPTGMPPVPAGFPPGFAPPAAGGAAGSPPAGMPFPPPGMPPGFPPQGMPPGFPAAAPGGPSPVGQGVGGPPGMRRP